jgi:hypothetical protein
MVTHPIDKAKKMVGLWTDDAKTLKQLSVITGKSQIELLHEALHVLAAGILNRPEEGEE